VYTVSLSVESGGCRGVHTASVTAEAAVKAGFSWLPSTACAGEQFSFTDESKAMRGTLKLRYWEFGDFSQSTDQNPAHLYIHPGEYAVSLVVTTGEGCTASAERLVEVWPADSCHSPDAAWIPNAFTPNGDGVNDYFFVQAPGMEIAGLDVFDRWGRRVYSAAGPARWDGRLRNGKPAPDGVYSFQITARWPGAAVRQITGHVLLLH
jgi:gliding motility-associated-like protein